MNHCDVFGNQPLLISEHKYKGTDNPSFEHQLLPPQAFCVYPTTYSNNCEAHALTPTNFGLTSSQVFNFSPQAIAVASNHPWPHTVNNAAFSNQDGQCIQHSFTDTNSYPVATPKFIHPRNSNVSQWLMSPPVVSDNTAASNVVQPALQHPPNKPLSDSSSNNFLTARITCDSPCFKNEPTQVLIPIAVFWDIENCNVPTGKSASAIVHKIRKKFFSGHSGYSFTETEFMAVCDINKESRQVIQDLNHAQVNVVHVDAGAKNAADAKLRQSIRRFAQINKSPATVILITGDYNFVPEVSDLRHRHNYFVVLVHPKATTDELKQAATRTESYEELVADIPVVYNNSNKIHTVEPELFVSNLPVNCDVHYIENRLRKMCSNRGGKVIRVNPPNAVLKFSDEESAKRALKQMNGDMINGCQIVVQRKTSDLSAFSKHFTPSTRRGSPISYCNNDNPYQPKCGPVFPIAPNNKPTRMKRNDHGVDLTISNIDSQLGNRIISETLRAHISQHTVIRRMNIRPHNRFTVVCDVTIPSLRDASIVMQALHRKKIGSKKILVTITQLQEDNNALLKKELLPLLQEYNNPITGIPFSRLMSLYSQSYQKSLKLLQLQQIPDLVRIERRPDANVVFLNADVETSTPLVCPYHYEVTQYQHERFLKINLDLREFSAKLHTLLHSHDGTLYIHGFESCYSADFGSFPYPNNSEGGVHLEHLISYVPGVQIIEGSNSKTVVWSQPYTDCSSDTASEASSSSRSKSSNLVNLTRDIVNFFKTFPFCCVPFADFQSLFHKCYSRSYPLDDASSLLEALSKVSHVVQIMGNSDWRMLTLTHRAQVKRFTQEIVKMLKLTPDKAILVDQMPGLYFKTFDRKWNLRDFGVNVLSDLLDDIPDGNICVAGEGNSIVLSLPQRERTLEEIDRTNQFARELVEILKTRHRFRVTFTEFVPTYHRHFGRQCKLSNYGFTKLIDLFEAIPHVVKIIDEGNDKVLRLTDEGMLKILTSQIVGLLRHKNQESECVPLNRLQSVFSRKYGMPLVPNHYNCENIEKLMKKLPHVVTLYTDCNGEVMVKPADRKPLRLLTVQLLVLMLDMKRDQLTINHLNQVYHDRYNENISPGEYGYLSLDDVIRKAMSGVAKFDDNCREIIVSLRPMYCRAKRIRNILLEHGSGSNKRMCLGEFNQSYQARFKEQIDFDKFGFCSNEAMLRSLTLVVDLKGFGIKKTIALKNHMLLGPFSSSLRDCDASDDLSNITKPTNSCTTENLVRSLAGFSLYSTNQNPSTDSLFDSLASSNNEVNTCSHRSSLIPLQSSYQNAVEQKHASSNGINSLHSTLPMSSVLSKLCPPPPRSTASPNYFNARGQFPPAPQLPSINGIKQQTATMYDSDKDSNSVFQLHGTPATACGDDVKQQQQSHAAHCDDARAKRRFSVSVITMPNGTASISSNSSPESFLSSDEDKKFMFMDRDHLLQHRPPQASPHLQLASSFAC